jgi:hypothetical protein
VAPVHCHKDIISFVLCGNQGDCKEKGLEQRQIQNGDRDANLFLFLVNLWAQGRSQCFSEKATLVPLTQPLGGKGS